LYRYLYGQSCDIYRAVRRDDRIATSRMGVRTADCSILVLRVSRALELYIRLRAELRVELRVELQAGLLQSFGTRTVAKNPRRVSGHYHPYLSELRRDFF